MRYKTPDLTELGVISSPRWTKWVTIGAVAVFIVCAFLADSLYPLKNIPIGYAWPAEGNNIKRLNMKLEVNPAMFYTTGAGSVPFNSLPYVLLVKAVYGILPYRLLSLRIVSVLCAVTSLFFLQRLLVVIFCPAVAALTLFLVATSPVYLEVMRSFGYLSLTNLVVTIACYLLAVNKDKCWSFPNIAGIVLCSALTFSLYAAGRVIILLTTLFFIFSGRTGWRKFLIYSISLVCLVLVLDLVLGTPALNAFKSTLRQQERLPRNLDYLRRTTGTPSLWAEWWRRLKWNGRIASYHFSLKRELFFHPDDGVWGRPDPIFLPAYLPFFFLGVGVCLLRRDRGRRLILLWALVFYSVMLFSSGMPVRRIALALQPILALIAVGVWFVYRSLYRLFLGRTPRIVLGSSLAVFLMLSGSCGLYNYFDRVARPPYDYRSSELKKFVSTLRTLAKRNKRILYNRQAEILMWGNPYFDRGDVDMKIVDQIEYEEFAFATPHTIRSSKLADQIDYAIREGGNIVYLHAFPPGKTPFDDGFWNARGIETARRESADKVIFSQISGMDEVYFMLIR